MRARSTKSLFLPRSRCARRRSSLTNSKVDSSKTGVCLRLRGIFLYPRPTPGPAQVAHILHLVKDRTPIESKKVLYKTYRVR